MAVLYTDAEEEALSEHLRKREILYTVSSIQSRKVETADDCCLILRDVSMHLRFPRLCRSDRESVEDKQQEGMLHKFFKAKNSCVLTPYVDRLIKTFGDYSPLIICDDVVSAIFKEYERLSDTLERRVIPETAQEFRNSAHYCILSQLKKYQGLLPGAKPVANLEFKGEKVFLKKFVTELHTTERWLK